MRTVLSNRGKVIETGDDIIFDKVPIVSPNGDILVRDLTFNVKPGVRLTRFSRLHTD